MLIQVLPGYANLGQVWTCFIRLFQVVSGYDRLGQFSSGYIR
jgi:hypothetical protein